MATGRQNRRDKIFAIALLAPALVCVIGLIGYPMYLIFMMSLREGRGMNLLDFSKQRVGLGNFADVLTDPQTWQSVVVSLGYTAGSMLPAFVLALGLALLLNQHFPLRRWLRALALLPWAIPGVLASIIFLWLFDASYGMVNYALRTTGLTQQDIAWFSNEDTALLAVIMPTIWKSFPFFTLTFVAAMQAIPADFYEAARTDGANAWQRFRHVTWPGIFGPAMLALVLNSLWAFREFDIIYVTTGGGPSRATETLGVRAYQEAFSYFELGRASVLGILMLAIALVFVLIARRPLQKEFF
jgi:multiple sugar transport system permease protein